jgi:hypothetical protein
MRSSSQIRKIRNWFGVPLLAARAGTLNFRGRAYPLSAGGATRRPPAESTTASCSADRGPCCKAAAVGCRRRLCRGGRGPCHRRRRRARHRADQPEGRRARTLRLPDRAEGERGSERARDYVEVGVVVVAWRIADNAPILLCKRPPRLTERRWKAKPIEGLDCRDGFARAQPSYGLNHTMRVAKYGCATRSSIQVTA